ncbi:unnamed protein product [Amoebophrya sp. A120]|nr:unnamed protein product [Amoebophrya sp. A120]|eukprot:GSA120T00013109001.1
MTSSAIFQAQTRLRFIRGGRKSPRRLSKGRKVIPYQKEKKIMLPSAIVVQRYQLICNAQDQSKTGNVLSMSCRARQFVMRMRHIRNDKVARDKGATGRTQKEPSRNPKPQHIFFLLMWLFFSVG